MNLIKDIYYFIVPRLNKDLKRTVFFGFLFLFISVSMEYPGYYIEKYLIDEVILPKKVFLLPYLCLLSFITALFFNIAFFFQNYYFSLFNEKFIKNIKTELYNKTLTLPINYFKSNQAGYICSRINDDAEELNGILALTLKDVLRDLLTIGFTITVMIYINWKLSLISLIMLPPFVINLKKASIEISKYNKKYIQERALYQQYLTETILGISTIKIYNYYQNRIKKNFNQLNEIYKFKTKANVITFLFSGIDAIINWFGPGLILLYGGYEVINNNLTIGELVVFISITSKIVGPTRRIMFLNIQIQKSYISMQRINEILLKTSENSNQIVEMDSQVKSIELINFSLNYENNKPIFSNINYKFVIGKKYLIIGENGCGKSSILSSIVNLNNGKSTGKILINGKLISDFSVLDLREKIIYVEQTPFLFNDTIENNIKFNNNDNEKFLGIMKTLFMEWVNEQTLLTQTVTGEHGNLLSGGQKQKISFARSLVQKNISVLLFDEITSNLDVEQKKLAFEILNKFINTNEMIIICVSHDEKIKKYFDEVLHLSHDGIITYYASNIV